MGCPGLGMVRPLILWRLTQAGGLGSRLVAGAGRKFISSRARRRARAGHFTRRGLAPPDRKSTRLNSSHMSISYAVFCLKKKKKKNKKHKYIQNKNKKRI